LKERLIRRIILGRVDKGKHEKERLIRRIILGRVDKGKP